MEKNNIVIMSLMHILLHCTYNDDEFDLQRRELVVRDAVARLYTSTNVRESKTSKKLEDRVHSGSYYERNNNRVLSGSMNGMVRREMSSEKYAATQ